MKLSEFLVPFLIGQFGYFVGLAVGWWMGGRRPASPRKEATAWDE
jgi:hypothetical protein